MIPYERTNWWRTCLTVHGSVVPHVLGRVGLLTAFCLALCLLDRYFLTVHGLPLPALDQLGHTVLGMAVSLLIVFRTNASNNRYWDGRAAWGGLVNGARNLARLGAAFTPPAEDLAHLLAAYAVAIRLRLRGERDLAPLASLVPGRILERAKDASNAATSLAGAIGAWIDERRQHGRIDSVQAVAMQNALSAMVDQQGACERIQGTPLPFVYAALIKQLLLVYLGTLPFVLVSKLGLAAPLAVAVVAFGMLGIEEAGVEIEDPFDLDPNSLPLEAICATIARDTEELTKK
jgi:putative membrane protein